MEYLPIDSLKPYERNNKKHPQTQIDMVAESIKQYGFVQPIVIDKNNVVVIGHCRLLAGKKLGLTEVPCISVKDLTKEQVRKLRILDNKTNESEWDFDNLKLELADLDFSDFGDIDFGVDFEDKEETIEDDAPEVDEKNEPTCKFGDVWVLGNHRLMCGDSTSEEDVKKLVGGAYIDLFITDPPYNVDYEGKTKDKLKIQNDKKEDSEFREFLIKAFSCANKVLKEGACFYIWHAESEGYNFRGACFDIGWKVRQCLIWNKNAMVMGRQDYQWKHEPCLYGWKEGASHLWVGDRKQTTVINFNKPLKNGEHPTMKPVGLFAYLIQNNTKMHDCVLDLFGGSGTSIIACEQLNRTCYMMELDPKYCDVIIKRWENLTGKKAIKGE